MLNFRQFAHSTFYNIIQCIKTDNVLPEAKYIDIGYNQL